MSASVSSTTDWLRPRITFSACLEIAGRCWVIALCGILLLTALLLTLQRTQAQVLREARLEIALQALRERLETTLSLGFELADSEQTQALLEDLLAQDPSLLAAEVFDASAISLFNTDRGAIGERVPLTWLTASSVNEAEKVADKHWNGARAWSVTNDDAFTLGLPIRGPFGQIAGQASITSALPPAPALRPVLIASLLAILLFTGASMMITIWLLRALDKQRNPACMELAAIRLRAAETRMAHALAELKRNEDHA